MGINFSPDYVIAIDGGGSTCRAVVLRAREGVIAEATGGSANVGTNFNAAVAMIEETIRSACENAGLTASDAKSACVYAGLAGCGQPGTSQRVRAALPGREIVIESDKRPALIGALGPQRDGVLAQLGTGSFFALRRGEQERFIGGWGLILSDDCSGAWLGRDLLRRVLQVIDGQRPASPLSQQVISQMGGHPYSIVQFARAATPPDFARFAPQIIAAASAQDPLARELMQDGAHHLAHQLNSLTPPETLPLVMTGGVSAAYQPYLPTTWRARLAPPQGTTLDGVITLARQKWLSS